MSNTKSESHVWIYLRSGGGVTVNYPRGATFELTPKGKFLIYKSEAPDAPVIAAFLEVSGFITGKNLVIKENK